MNVYIVIFAFLCEASAFRGSEEYENVGTVLFTPSDVEKHLWSDKEIKLLQARQLLQKLIPPPSVIDPQNDRFYRSILNYMKTTFSSIKDESTDPESQSIMMTALADTMGGYLKMWLLPITKFAYYGGSVPEDDAIKLFQFYKSLKSYLHTDGTSWHNPSTYFLNSMTINVIKRRSVRKKTAKKLCEKLAYLEKTNSGLTIPLPKVNWNANFMFLPLKGSSLISLHSLNSSDALLEYYDAAKNCIETGNLSEHHNFHNRFQNWLVREVIPHLNDEELYPAFGGVLACTNMTLGGDFAEDVAFVHIQPPKKCRKPKAPFDLSSTKCVILMALILIELAWCIPTLCYVFCRKLKKIRRSSNVYLFLDPKDYKVKRTYAETTQYSSIRALPQNCNIATACALRHETTNKKIETSFCKLPTASKSCHTCHSGQFESRYSRFVSHAVDTGTKTFFRSQLTQSDVNKIIKEPKRSLQSKRYILDNNSILSNDISTNSLTADKSVTTNNKYIHKNGNFDHFVTKNHSKEKSNITNSFIKKSVLPSNTVGRRLSIIDSVLKKSSIITDDIAISSSTAAISKQTSLLSDTVAKNSSMIIKKFKCTPCLNPTNSNHSNQETTKTSSVTTIRELIPSKTVSILNKIDSISIKSFNIEEVKHIIQEAQFAEIEDKNSYVSETKNHNVPSKEEGGKLTSSTKQVQSSSIDAPTNKNFISTNNTISYKPVPIRWDKHVKSSKSKGVKLSSGYPYLEITIDRPQREICVDISNAATVCKPSKIPRRYVSNKVAQTQATVLRNNQSMKNRNNFPQIRRQITVDDIDIKSKNPCRGSKFNSTF